MAPSSQLYKAKYAHGLTCEHEMLAMSGHAHLNNGVSIKRRYTRLQLQDKTLGQMGRRSARNQPDLLLDLSNDAAAADNLAQAFLPWICRLVYFCLLLRPLLSRAGPESVGVAYP